MEFISTPLAHVMKASGIMIYNVEKVWKLGWTILNMKENISMERSTGLVSTIGPTGVATKASGRII